MKPKPKQDSLFDLIKDIPHCIVKSKFKIFDNECYDYSLVITKKDCKEIKWCPILNDRHKKSSVNHRLEPSDEFKNLYFISLYDFEMMSVHKHINNGVVYKNGSNTAYDFNNFKKRHKETINYITNI